MNVGITVNTLQKELFSLASKISGTEVISVDYQQKLPNDSDEKFDIQVGFYQLRKIDEVKLFEQEINRAIDNSNAGKFPKKE